MKHLKKIFGLMCLLVLAISSVALTSCSSDDDGGDEDWKHGGLTIKSGEKTYSKIDNTPGFSTHTGTTDYNSRIELYMYEDGSDDIMPESFDFGFESEDAVEGEELEGAIMLGSPRSNQTGGKATVISKSDTKVTIQFDNLTFANGTTINGTAEFDYGDF